MPNSPDILGSVPCGKTEVRPQPVADVITVEHIRLAAEIEQFTFQFGRDRGFASAGQAGHPNYVPAMAVAQFALLRRDLATAPENIVALVIRVVGAARVVVGGDNSTTRHVKAVHDDKTAGGNDVRMNIESDGRLGVERQFGHFITSDE